MQYQKFLSANFGGENFWRFNIHLSNSSHISNVQVLRYTVIYDT